MSNNLFKSFYFLFHVLFPVIVGGLIYTIYRDENILLFEWYNYLGISFYTLELRNFFNPQNLFISNFLTQNLPDGLWVYSFTSCMLLIWGKKNPINKYIYIIIPMLLSIFSELGQLFKFIRGTFDPLDLIFYLFFTIFSVLIYNITVWKKENF